MRISRNSRQTLSDRQPSEVPELAPSMASVCEGRMKLPTRADEIRVKELPIKSEKGTCLKKVPASCTTCWECYAPSVFDRGNLRKWSVWRWAAMIFVISFAARAAVLFAYCATHTNYALEDTEIGRVAIQLAGHNQFANPFSKPTGPTAHVAPVYPFLTSIWVRVLGTGNATGLATCLTNIFFVSAAYSLLPLLAWTASLPIEVGALAGIVPAAIPFSAFVEMRLSEAPLLFLLLVIASIAYIRLLQSGRLSAARALGFGALCGLLLLTSPVVLLVLIGFFIAGFILCLKSGRVLPYLRFALFSALAMSLVLSPWVLRNYRVFGHLFLVRSNVGMELKLSNHDGASPLLEVNEGSDYFYKNHPFWSRAEADSMNQMGEIAYNRLALRTALSWIRTRPAVFLRLCLERFVNFWFMPGWPPLKAIILFPMVLLAGWGAFRMIRDHPIAGWVLATVPVMFPLVYYVVQVANRYRLPMYWTIYFFASYALLSRKFTMESQDHVRA